MYNLCLLYTNKPFGLVGLQIDNTLFLADTKFAAKEQINFEKARFLAKDQEQLTVDYLIKFNRGLIQLNSDGIILTQACQCKNLKPISKVSTVLTSLCSTVYNNLIIEEQYVAQRARGAYIASVSQLKASFNLLFAAQIINLIDANVKALNKRLQQQINNPARGLRFVKLN